MEKRSTSAIVKYGRLLAQKLGSIFKRERKLAGNDSDALGDGEEKIKKASIYGVGMLILYFSLIVLGNFA